MAQASRKTLLLTGSPPGMGHVGEIILRDLVLHAGIGRFCGVAVVSPRYKWKPDTRLAGLGVDVLTSTHLVSQRWSRSKWASPGSLLGTAIGFRREVSRLQAQIESRIRKEGAQQLFCVLNNPLMFSLAHRVAARTGLPLISLVWDPPDYLLRQAGFDRWSRGWLVAEFEKSLKASRRVAVVSENMQVDYGRITSAPIQLLRHGLPLANVPDASDAGPPGEWLIGFAGSMYSNCAWRAFLRALDHAEWRIAGKPVRLRLLTGRVELATRKPARIEFLGYRPSDEAQALLRECHATYMPQPFVPYLRDLCRYSFPTKLTNYLALGRPVFVHAPPEGALSTFYGQNPIGAHADSLESEAIVAALEGLLGNAENYRDACRQVSRVAQVHFADGAFHAAVDRFVDGDTEIDSLAGIVDQNA